MNLIIFPKNLLNNVLKLSANHLIVTHGSKKMFLDSKAKVEYYIISTIADEVENNYYNCMLKNLKTKMY
jgi:hypothetical protein